VAEETLMSIPSRLALVAFMLAAAGLARAGTVEVIAVNPATFADAGDTKRDEPVNIRKLTRFLQDLGARLLPADENVRIELLDVDLAGSVKNPTALVPLRTVDNRTDFPSIRLRYTVQVASRPARAGEETVSDPDYLRGIRGVHSDEELYYDKRMLERWFNQRFVQAQ
jgi:hypothetical protein